MAPARPAHRATRIGRAPRARTVQRVRLGTTRSIESLFGGCRRWYTLLCGKLGQTALPVKGPLDRAAARDNRQVGRVYRALSFIGQVKVSARAADNPFAVRCSSSAAEGAVRLPFSTTAQEEGATMNRKKNPSAPTVVSRRTGIDRRWIPSAHHQPERRQGTDRRARRPRSLNDPLVTDDVAPPPAPPDFSPDPHPAADAPPAGRPDRPPPSLVPLPSAAQASEGNTDGPPRNDRQRSTPPLSRQRFTLKRFQ